MKRILLLSLCTTALLFANAQDLKKVSTMMILNKLDEAKVELDKALADPKNQAKPEAAMWKGKIYAAFYKDASKYSAKYPNALSIADESLQKYLAQDPSLKVMKDNNATDAFFDLYGPSFNNGVRTFGTKAFDSAFYYFTFAVKYSDVIFKNKLSSNTTIAFDTTSILYAGIAAENAKKPGEAIKYYERLMDNKVEGESNSDIYKSALIYYVNTKDETKFRNYLAIAKQIFPKVDWEDYENEYMSKNYSLDDNTNVYKKEDAAGTLSAQKYQQFGDVFANISKEDKAKLDSNAIAQYQQLAADAFKKAAIKDPSNGISAFNAGVIYYNIYTIYDDRVSDLRRTLQEINTAYREKPEKDPKKKAAADAKLKEQTEAIKKQRAEIEKPLFENLDASIEWLEKAFTILKDKATRNNTEKSCLNKSIDFLANLYGYKRDKSSGKDPKAYDMYDAKYKLYDGLHGKY
ncbi:MAG: hypothetical protein ACOVNY_09290 [Chitinophagaceae bacterium]